MKNTLIITVAGMAMAAYGTIYSGKIRQVTSDSSFNRGDFLQIAGFSVLGLVVVSAISNSKKGV